MSRKHISLKTKLCSALMLAYNFDYRHAKELTEDQFLSLFQWDHNILHETGHEHVDKFWNLTPMWIPAHREKTKRDQVIIAKGRRIRAKNAAADAPVLRIGPGESKRHAGHGAHDAAAPRPAHSPEEAITTGPGDLNHTIRKLRSRGFDKRLRKKMDGTVVKR